MGHADSQDQKSAGRFKRMMGSGSPRLRSVVVAAGIIGVVAAPVGVAATGDVLKEGVRNGTTTSETEIVSNIGSTTTLKGGYSTRQSNLSSTGGGAIYGCRSGQGGSAANPPQNPCVRANNLEQGYAFEFNATKGPVVGLISASGAGGDAVKPFITNATGVATGLNADRVDGLNAGEIAKAAADVAAADATTKADAAKDRWVTVREIDGGGATIVQQTGGFELVNCYTANGNCYIDANEDVTNNAAWAEILTENTPSADDNPGTDGAAALAGATSVAPCFFDFVNCGPDGTEGNRGVFVVTPRNAEDGASPDSGDRYTFTAFISAAEAKAAG